MSPVCSTPLPQDDERDDALPGGLVRRADYRGLCDIGMFGEGRFDLGGGDAVPGGIHDVVDPAEHPHGPVLVVLGSVAGEVPALLGVAGPVGFAVIGR